VKKLLDTGLIKIPVLGSGDLFSPLCVHKYLSYTGASGVILARGAIHNPRIFLLKSRLLDREVPLIESGNHTSHEEDWKESLLEPSSSTEESPSKLEEELAANTGNLKKKSGKSEYEEESIEFS
jgi:tRNA-dihydrouridine synthase